jgi:hypothetical protein
VSPESKIRCSSATAVRVLVTGSGWFSGNREIRGREPPLREQRAEDEDRLIAALHGLGHVDPRPESRLRSLDTRVRFVDRRRERPCVGGFALCASDCVLERQGRLCQRWSHPHHQHAEQQGERV